MKITYISAALAGLMMTTAPAAFAQDAMVKEVQVAVDLASVQNTKAADYYAQLPADLQNAIVADLAGKYAADSEDGLTLSVDIDEVSLANGYEAAAGTADSALTGRVVTYKGPERDEEHFYDLSVTFADAGATYLPAGTDMTVIRPGSAEYYQAMVAAFAGEVAKRIE